MVVHRKVIWIYIAIDMEGERSALFFLKSRVISLVSVVFSTRLLAEHYANMGRTSSL